MIEEIINGVTAAIRAEFPDTDIYTEAVEQGMREPCFSIKCIRPAQEQVVGERYFRRHLIRIYYFPAPDGDKWSEINTVQDKLLDCLEMIRCGGDPVRGTEMETRIEDDVGIFLVNYNFFVRRRGEEGPDMNELLIKEEVQ